MHILGIIPLSLKFEVVLLVVLLMVLLCNDFIFLLKVYYQVVTIKNKCYYSRYCAINLDIIAVTIRLQIIY